MSTWDALGTVLVVGAYIALAALPAWALERWLSKHLDK